MSKTTYEEYLKRYGSLTYNTPCDSDRTEGYYERE